jgi:transcriptional regulator with XRE-family HTH domain
MNDTLNPEALKYYRKKLGWSQDKLAAESKISKAQISRYERGQQTSRIHQVNRERLCGALRVNWEKLTRAPETKDFSWLRNRVALKDGIEGSARTALTYMQLRYGLVEEAIIDLAPLAFLILAERSLQARKAALDETEAAFEDATSDAMERLPYMRGAFYGHYDWEWIAAERKSLDEREVYEQYVDDEGEEMSPFVDFLEKELKSLGLFQEHPIEFSSSFRGAPGYAIPVESLARALDLDAADEADQSVLDLIQDGRIDLWQVWEKKSETTKEDFRCWLDEKRQAAEEDRRRRLPKFMLNLAVDPASSTGSAADTEGQA